MGWTFEGSALESQINCYFENKDAYDGHVRPVVIAVITDGLPISPSGVRKAIVKATERMERPDEIAITFLQIGTDRHGVKFVHQLDDKLIAKGARYDIVDCKDFEELQRIGLAQALVDAINEASIGAVRAGSDQQERDADISSPQRRLPIEANQPRQ